MSLRLNMMSLATLLAAASSFAQMSTTTAVTAPSTGVTAVLATSGQTSAPMGYPKPPKAMAIDSAMFLEYYSMLWAKADYVKMYGALCGEAREACPFEKFSAALDERRKVNGGVKSFSAVKELRKDDYESEWSLTINYVRATAAPLTIRVTLVKDVDVWEIKSGGLLPMDEALFDR